MKTNELLTQLRDHLRTITIAASLAVALSGTVAIQFASAHAPALATVTTDAALYASPDSVAPILAHLASGATITLTGTAVGDYLEIVAGDVQGWVGVDDLDDGRFDTAHVDVDTSLRGGTGTDASIVQHVPAGSTVTLTGASLDGFLAATFDGAGGWIPAAAIS